MLHLISASFLQTEIVERIAAGDDVLLQRGTIWAALNGHADNGKLGQLLALPANVYVLTEMLEVNGIEPSRLLAGIEVTDYPGLVELTVKNPVTQTWY